MYTFSTFLHCRVKINIEGFAFSVRVSVIYDSLCCYWYFARASYWCLALIAAFFGK